ncbi:MAG: tetratricopeptide repeat-containing sulfotransferase family protein [Steroidobacteraceae bacterium]
MATAEPHRTQGPAPTGGRPEPVGTVEVALAHAARLLERNPNLAILQAREILLAFPAHPQARLLLGKAERLGGNARVALDVLEALAREWPEWGAVQLELGVALGQAGRGPEAITALRSAARCQPELPEVWRILADHLDAQNDARGADEARAHYLKAVTQDPHLMQAAAELVANRLPAAEALLRAHLRNAPTDIAALRMLAEVAARLRRYGDAQVLLERCLELAPSFSAARHNYATVLNRQAKAAQALPHVERLLAEEPRNPGYRALQAAVLANLGDYARSITIYEAFLKEFPQQAKIWMSYGHSLKTAGRQDDCVAAYRRAIQIQPTLGEAYWSLANLKTFRFVQDDIGAIRGALERDDLTDDDRLHFEFALGKALEDREAYEQSFAHYAKGNALRRKHHTYDADEHSAFVRRSIELYTAQFYAERSGCGCPAGDPIFIVGMPRSGSTLLEQILASHSLVEGTMELPTLPAIVLDLGGGRLQEQPRYPDCVAGLASDELRTLGERYMTGVRAHRKTEAPYFIDKMPNNCLHVGLIQLMLPNAKIIDARRHPLGCCFSGFKQQFARGQNFSYGLSDIGRYYHDYVQLMAHFDAVRPGMVHRVFYEQLIENTAAEVRRLLAYCGLPFEEQCLRFYENTRAVRTASSEQVRQPIFREGLDHWRHFEPWLGPLKEALGSVLESYTNFGGTRYETPSSQC